MDNVNLLSHLGDLSPCELTQKGLLHVYINVLLNGVITGCCPGNYLNLSLCLLNKWNLISPGESESIIPVSTMILLSPFSQKYDSSTWLRLRHREQTCRLSRGRWGYGTNWESSTETYTLLLLLLSCFSRVWLCATPQTAAHQAPPSLGFSRQEHWSGLPFPSPMHESESEVAQSCPTLWDPIDGSPPGSSVHGIFQARVLKWGAIAFSNTEC